MKRLAITGNKGFHIEFENGLRASVQWGRGNYCDNHFNDKLDFRGTIPAESNNAEVAVFGVSGEFLAIEQFLPNGCSSDDTVAGWLTPDQIVDFLANVKNVRSELQC